MNPAPFSLCLQWQAGPSAELRYRCLVPAETLPGQHSPAQWLIRINDFPQQPLYTLLIDGVAYADFDTWPACWQR